MSEPTPDGRPPIRRDRRARRRIALRVLLPSLVGLLGFHLIVRNPGLLDWKDDRFVGPVAFSPDGAVLAWIAEGRGGSSLVVWDLDRRRRRLIVRGRGEPEADVDTTFTAPAFSPDGGTIAVGARSAPIADHRVILLNAVTGRARTVFRGHSDAILAVAYAPDGATLATASRDRTVRLWDVGTGRTRATLRAGTAPVSALAFSPDGRTLASGWGDRDVRLHDVRGGRLSAVLKGHTQGVTGLAYSPDGATLASAGFDGTVRFWDCATDRERAKIGGFATPCRSMAFAPGGAILAMKFAESSIGVLWDVAAGREAATFDGAAGGLAIAPRGGTLAVGGGGKGKVYLIALPRPHPAGQ